MTDALIVLGMILSAMVGAGIGVVATALLVAAKRGDKRP